jgi:hypothetical protein
METHEIIIQRRLERAVRSAPFCFRDLAGARAFLQRRDNGQKDGASRYLAWLMVLGGLPEDPELWAQGLYYSVRGYRAKFGYYLNDGTKDLPDCLDPKLICHIREDISRAIFLFEGFAHALGIPAGSWTHAETSVARVTIIMLSEAPQFDYIQGYDRFAIVSYALGLATALRFGLGQIEGEAFAIRLFRRLVPLSGAHAYLVSQGATRDYFCDVDAYLRVFQPLIMQTLAQAAASSVSFALNWSGLLFLDQKTPLDVLLIWDQFVLRNTATNAYFKAMTAAHLNQVPRMDTAFEQLGAIQRMASWDVPRLLDDAEKFASKTSWSGSASQKKDGLAALTWLFF